MIEMLFRHLPVLMQFFLIFVEFGKNCGKLDEIGEICWKCYAPVEKFNNFFFVPIAEMFTNSQIIKSEFLYYLDR